MGCCLLGIVGLVLPRVAMVVILLFTRWFEAVFATWLWPLLGFIFAPYTTLAYMAAVLDAGAITPFWIVVIVVGALADASHWGGGYRWRTRRTIIVRR